MFLQILKYIHYLPMNFVERNPEVIKFSILRLSFSNCETMDDKIEIIQYHITQSRNKK